MRLGAGILRQRPPRLFFRFTFLTDRDCRGVVGFGGQLFWKLGRAKCFRLPTVARLGVLLDSLPVKSWFWRKLKRSVF